jgi:hypothetical protein
LKDKQGEEKAKVTPKKARNLRLDSGARELEGRDIRAGDSTARSCKRKEHLEKRVGDDRRYLQPPEHPCKEKEKGQATHDHAQENRSQHDEAWIREGYIPAWIREWPLRHQIRLRLE